MMASTSCSSKESFTIAALPYDLPYLPAELKKRARLELFEDEETKIHSLKLLRSMLKDEPHLNFYDNDEYLIQYLRARKYDVKRAFNLVKTFYSVKIKHDELFDEYDNNDIIRALKENCTGFLPFRDADCCCILVLKIDRWNPSVNSMGNHLLALTAGLIHAIRIPATQIAGFKVIVDMKGLSFKQVAHLSPRYLFLMAEALQNCFPARFKGMHVVNEGYLFTSIWTILKQFLTKKITDRFHFHGKNVSKLHKYFLPSILPAEYEGDLPSFDNSEWANKVLQNLDYVALLNSYGYTKTKRRKSSSS